jgi:hexosaminidase
MAKRASPILSICKKDTTFPTHTHTHTHWHAQAYTFNPVANLSTEQAKLILGGQHLLWTEQSGPENLDPTVWPRAAASAELFWTGPVANGSSSGRGGDDERNVRTALPRLHELVYRFRRRGVRAISLQPEWCALRPFECDLDA